MTSRADRILERLRRRTSSGRFIPEVDGLRFLAISMVVVFHLQVMLDLLAGSRRMMRLPFGTAPLLSGAPARDLMSRVIDQGKEGVSLFFILSGFILALPFAERRFRGGPTVSLRRYYTRRLTRLEPPYLIALCVSLGAGLAATAGTSWTSVWPRFVAGLGYLHNAAFSGHNPINSPFWSLEVEVQFYLVVPALATLFLLNGRLNRRIAVVAVSVAMAIVQTELVFHSTRLSLSLLGYIQFFLAGFLLADVYVHDWKMAPSKSRVWDVVTLVGWPAFIATSARADAISLLALPWLGALVFVAAFRGTYTSRALSNRWVRTTGGMAYSIYLLHMPVIVLLTPHVVVPGVAGHLALGLTAVAVIPVILAAGTAFYALVERPCMDPRWHARLWSRIVEPRRVRIPDERAAAEDLAREPAMTGDYS